MSYDHRYCLADIKVPTDPNAVPAGSDVTVTWTKPTHCGDSAYIKQYRIEYWPVGDKASKEGWLPMGIFILTLIHVPVFIAGLMVLMTVLYGRPEIS